MSERRALTEGKTQCPFHSRQKQNQASSPRTSCQAWKNAEGENGLLGRGDGRGSGLEDGILLAVPGWVGSPGRWGRA